MSELIKEQGVLPNGQQWTISDIRGHFHVILTTRNGKRAVYTGTYHECTEYVKTLGRISDDVGAKPKARRG